MPTTTLKTTNLFNLLKYQIPFLFFKKGKNKKEEVFFEKNILKTHRNHMTLLSGETADKEKLIVAVDEREPELVLVSLRVQRDFWVKNELVHQFEFQVLQPIEKFFGKQRLDTIRQNVQIHPKGKEWELSAEIELSQK